MGKAFELSLVVGASLASTFRSTLSGAQKQLGKLGTAVSSLESQSAKLGRATALQQGMAETKRELALVRQGMGTTGQSVDQLKASLRSQGAELGKLRSEFKAAGMATSDFASQQQRLDKSLASLQASRTRIQDTMSMRQANLDRRGEMHGQMLGVAGMALSLAAPIREAMKFESVMADVKKVMDVTPAQFGALRKEVLNLSSAMPMSQEGFARIYEAAGQAGIPRQELEAFASSAAKMGIAFDISAEAAGSTMAAWRAGMGLSQERVVLLADSVNWLSNNMNATAGDLAGLIRRQGATAMTAGLAEQEVAALGAALLSSGASEEVAATALKNFTNALTKGEAATKSQDKVYRQLGLNASDVAKSMQKDAEGTIKLVLNRISELPKHMRGAAVGQLFGEESKGAIMPLLNNMQNLEQAFSLVGKESNYAGSMQKEFEERSKTTENSVQLLKNNLLRLGITLGSVLLPHVNAIAKTIGSVAQNFAAWAEDNPKLTKTLVVLGAGAIGLKVGMFALGYAFTFIKGAVLNARLAMDTMRGGLAMARARALGTIPAYNGLGAAMKSFAANPIKAVLGGLRAVSMAMLTNPIGWIALAIGAAAGLIYKYWKPIKGFFQGLWTGISQGIQPIMGALQPAIGLFKGLASAIMEFFGTQAKSGAQAQYWGIKIGQSIGEGITTAANFIKTGIALFTDFSGAISYWGEQAGAAVQSVVGFFSGIGEKVSSTLSGLGTAISTNLQTAFQTVLQAITTFDPIATIQGLFNKVTAYLGSINWFEQGKRIITTLVSGIKSVGSGILNSILGMFGKADEANPHSDAKIGPFSRLTESGRSIPLTLGEGVRQVGAKAITGPLQGSFAQAMGATQRAEKKFMDIAPTLSFGAEGPEFQGINVPVITPQISQGLAPAISMDTAMPPSGLLDTPAPASPGLAEAAAGAQGVPAGQSATTAGGPVVHYNVHITVNGDSGGTVEQLKAGLEQTHDDLMRKLLDLQHQARRVSFV